MSFSERIMRAQKFRRLAGAVTTGVFAERVGHTGGLFDCFIFGVFLSMLISDVTDMLAEDA